MPQHADVPQLYLLMMSLLLGQQLKQLPRDVAVSYMIVVIVKVYYTSVHFIRL